ncbi:MAG TPA: AAA family ATPase [Solirubrobacteraceae bacterium]|nr:AAA family ATPase [Solirubrobacteraceae bacterium]
MTAFDAEVTIRRTRFSNAENGFAVVDADGDDGEHLVLVGPLIHLEERERARILGSWVEDRRYGPQVKVAEAHPLPPADSNALEAYLRRVKHVGRKRAQALIDRHRAENVLDAIDRDPAAAFRAVGLSWTRAAEAAGSWHALRVTRQLHLLLAPHGLSYLVTRIHEEYGATAHRVLSTNPYELTRVFGVGFAIADRIALGTGCSRDNPGRARAALIHLLSEAERSGSTCLPLEALLPAARQLLGEPCDIDEVDVDELVTAGDLTRDGDWIYRTATAELEEELAERVRTMLSSGRSARLRELEWAPDVANGVDGGAGLGHGTAADWSLTDEQLTAVQAAFAHRLSVITGGPGTGKTATIKTIAAEAAQQNARVKLVAPTGRAASRMSEASGLTATTVHSALGWIPGEGPTHDEDDPVRCDLLILDESSMANLELMVTLLRAVPSTAHLVLVGDADQLAPVGAGKPFAELIAAGLVPSARLTHIFRQAAGSMIVQGAHAVRRGETPEFRPGDEMRRDLFLIERADPIAAREEIVALVTERLPAHYGVDPVSDIQVFAPVYKGELGIDALNEALRDALNPDGRKIRGGRLRIGDKLMMTGRNMHELRLMNGTLLRLVDEVDGAEGDDPALLLAGEESVFRLPPEESERLRLAYACSVHRGQGIELPVAVIVAHPAAGAYFLRREMLYTAITRAKLATVIVGLRGVVARAARSPDTSRRHCRLAERLS